MLFGLKKTAALGLLILCGAPFAGLAAKPPAAPQGEKAAMAAAALVEARERFAAEWLGAAAGAGLDEEQGRSLLGLVTKFRDMPGLLGEARAILDKAQGTGGRDREAVAAALDAWYGKRREALALRNRILRDLAGYGWSSRPASWEAALADVRQGELASARADRLATLFPGWEPWMWNELLPDALKADETPGLLEIVAERVNTRFAEPGPDALPSIRRVFRTALADPRGFAGKMAEEDAVGAFAERLLAERGLRLRQQLPFEGQAALFSLRNDAEALALAGEMLELFQDRPAALSLALQRLGRDKEAFKSWWAGAGAQVRFQTSLEAVPPGTASESSYRDRGTAARLMAVKDILPEAAATFEAVGSRPLKASSVAVSADLPAGEQPNGLVITPVTLSRQGPGREEAFVVEKLPLREGQSLYACAWHPSSPEARRVAEEETGKVLRPIPGAGPVGGLSIGAELIPWDPVFEDLWSRYMPHGYTQTVPSMVMVTSAAPEGDVADHLAWLSVMRCPADSDDVFTATPGSGAGKAARPARPEWTAEPAPRFIAPWNGLMFLALARVAGRDELDRLFGPLDAVYVPWPDPKHTWRELRRAEAGPLEAGRPGKTPVLDVPEAALPLLRAYRDMLRQSMVHVCLERSSDDQSAECWALAGRTVALCREAGIHPSEWLKVAVWVKELGAGNEDGVARARALLATPEGRADCLGSR